jgi:putative ABC transport system permease protein
MFQNYFKSAFRFLKHNKIFAFINAFSLAIALAVSFIIMLYVVNEFSYDLYYPNFKRIFRALNYYVDYKKSYIGTPYVLASALKDEYPQIEKSISVRPISNFRIKVQDEYYNVLDAAFTDSDVFNIFSLSILKSNRSADLLEDKNSIVISQKLAEKIFPGQDPVGKEITGQFDNEDHLLVIIGIFKDIPENSTFKAQCLMSSKLAIETINKAYSIKDADKNWTINSWTTWILLSKNSDARNLEKQFHSFELKNLGQNSHYQYLLQKLSDVYLGSENIGNAGQKGNIKNIRLFITIALLIIIVAASNYIILSTSVSSERAKEIGLRKTFGAGNSDIKYQLYGESIFLAIIVFPIALFLMWLALPLAGKLFQNPLHIIPSNILSYILISFGLTLFIGIASGIYTSTILSRLEVNSVLKNSIQLGNKKTILRSSLIIFQLIIFCSFVSTILIIHSQYQYAIKRDPAHYNSNIVMINLGLDFKGYSAFINNIKAIPNVIMATGTRECLPMQNSGIGMFPNYQNKDVLVQLELMPIDFHFLETMGIKLVAGRYFSTEFGSDMTQSIILNETAVKKLDITNPVGKKYGPWTIIGVVKDFNLHSIHSEIPATLIQLTDKYILQVAVRYKPGSLGIVLPMIESEWKKFVPNNRHFSFLTIEELIKSLYSSEKDLNILVIIFALLTILIAASGLFGLTLFIARTRTKEIGIKKVFGCSEQEIIISFLQNNFFLVLTASLISIPIALYFMTKWLSNFAYKINISWWIFVEAFSVAIIVVLFTVYFHSYKASRVNPVKSLRYE